MTQRAQKQTHAPQQTAALFDHFVGGHLQDQWHRKTKRDGEQAAVQDAITLSARAGRIGASSSAISDSTSSSASITGPFSHTS